VELGESLKPGKSVLSRSSRNDATPVPGKAGTGSDANRGRNGAQRFYLNIAAQQRLNTERPVPTHRDSESQLSNPRFLESCMLQPHKNSGFCEAGISTSQPKGCVSTSPRQRRINIERSESQPSIPRILHL